jgi:DinB family protein
MTAAGRLARPVDGPPRFVYRHMVMAPASARALVAWRRRGVRRMTAVRRSTLAFLAQLPEPELLRPRTQDRWSVKDVLAHLVSCDEETIRRFRLIGRGRGDHIHWFESMADADRFNARSVARLRGLGLRPLLARMKRVHAELIRQFERLPAESLRDPSHAYPVVEWLPAPGWSHEREHLSEVRQWWRSRRRALGRQRSDRRTPARSKGR